MLSSIGNILAEKRTHHQVRVVSGVVQVSLDTNTGVNGSVYWSPDWNIREISKIPRFSRFFGNLTDIRRYRAGVGLHGRSIHTGRTWDTSGTGLQLGLNGFRFSSEFWYLEIRDFEYYRLNIYIRNLHITRPIRVGLEVWYCIRNKFNMFLED